MRRVSALLRRLRDEHGYSLVEMLTVLVILGIVMGGLTTLFVQGSNAEIDMNKRFQAQTEARVGLDKIRRETHTACAASQTPSSGAAWAVTLTFRSASTTLSGAQATNTGTLTVVSTSAFPSSGTLTVNGLSLAYTGKTATTFTGVTGGNSTVQADGTAVTTTTTCSGSASFATWCTRANGGSTTRFGLYRVTGSSCGSSGGTRWADYLTSSPTAATCSNGSGTALCIFSVTAQSTTNLAQVHIDLPVNSRPAKTVERYEIVDDLVLRNSCRVSGACTT
jgi:prepilin-type N-terminal cleavage/methylation domain-containing protein